MSESIYLCRAPDKAVVTIFNISSYESVSGQKFKPPSGQFSDFARQNREL